MFYPNRPHWDESLQRIHPKDCQM